MISKVIFFNKTIEETAIGEVNSINISYPNGYITIIPHIIKKGSIQSNITIKLKNEIINVTITIIHVMLRTTFITVGNP